MSPFDLEELAQWRALCLAHQREELRPGDELKAVEAAVRRLRGYDERGREILRIAWASWPEALSPFMRKMAVAEAVFFSRTDDLWEHRFGMTSG